MFLSAIITHPYVFIFVFASGLGISSGMGYVPPITLCIKYFPNKKSVVTGTIMCGIGISSFILGFVALAIVNPDNKKPTIIVKEGEVEDKYYTRDVYQNVIYIYIYIYE